MMTANEIQELVEAHWPVTRRSKTAQLLFLKLDDVEQKVLVELAADRGRPALLVVAEIGPGRLLPSEKALEYNATAAHGALAIARGMLVLRQLLALDTLVPDDVHGAVRAGAVEAARIRRSVSRPAMRAELSRVTFAHLAD